MIEIQLPSVVEFSPINERNAEQTRVRVERSVRDFISAHRSLQMFLR